MLPNGENRLARPIGIEKGDQLSPILVTSVGRSGSTLLMDQPSAPPASSAATIIRTK